MRILRDLAVIGMAPAPRGKQRRRRHHGGAATMEMKVIEQQ